ncbi:MAG: transposase [archaeon]|nr:transposase [archaeon]
MKKRPTIAFYPEIKKCPICSNMLSVRKTVPSKQAHSLAIGTFYIHETIMHCQSCENSTIYYSEGLRKLIPFRCRYSYDVLVFVGTKMFLHSWDVARIKNKIESRGIMISSSEISYLAKKFIVYLTQIHRENQKEIRQHMSLNGGYILHLDGTMEADSPVLMSVLDGITGFVLDNVKIPSENSKYLIPFLKGIKNDYGSPLALVHDMGSGILKAVKKVFPAIPDFICHFHFLRDIGKDLMDKEYKVIRKRLKKHGTQNFLNTVASPLKEVVENNLPLVFNVKEKMNGKNNEAVMPAYTASVGAFVLIKWVLNGKKQGKGYGYPFDRPLLNLYQRLKDAYEAVDILRNSWFKGEGKEKRVFGKLWRKLYQIVNDRELKKAVFQIEKKVKVFDKLRVAMQITDLNGKDGLNDAGKITSSSIEKNVKAFSKWLSGYNEDKDYETMNIQIKKYWKKLFSDPITIKNKFGNFIVQPQRTNNILERFFRDFRRMNRKKTGFDSLTKTLKSMIADTPVVKNLENKEYVKIILNGKKTLEERFADVETEIIKEQLAEVQRKVRKVPKGVAEIINIQNFTQKLVEAMLSCKKSNALL